jgi:hypothetical protein
VSKQNGDVNGARLKRIEANLTNLHNQLGVLIEICAGTNEMMGAMGQAMQAEMQKTGILLPEGVVPPLDLEP